MTKRKRLAILAAFIGLVALSSSTILAVDNSEVVIPAFGDKYSLLVKTLESGNTDIDYKEFRGSFLDSKQFGIASAKQDDLHRLNQSLPVLIAQSNYTALIRVTKEILSIDYTDMQAHKILQQTYKILGDKANMKKYHDIEFGLLNSIVKNGDGKSCATAWPVIQIKEEYFILQMLGAKVTKQSINNEGGICDKMDVSVGGRNETYYFGIAKVVGKYDQSRLK